MAGEHNMPSMPQILRLFLDIALLRAAPQDIPYSPALLRFALAAYAMTGLLIALPSNALPAALGQMAVDLLLVLGFVQLLLTARNRKARFVQTATALAGAGIVLNVAALPLLLAAGDLPQGIPAAPLPGLALLALVVWTIVVFAHVARHAAELPMPVAVVISVVWFFVAQLALSLLFAPLAGGAKPVP